MIDLQPRADRRVEAALVRAGAFAGLAAALEAVHVGGGAAHVGEGAAEVRMGGDPPGLADNGGRTAALHGPALVHGDGAEVALAVAAAVGGQGEADGVERPHRAALPVGRVQVAGELQVVDRVQFRDGQRQLRRVVDEEARVLLLGERLCGDRVAVVVEGAEHGGEPFPVSGRLREGWQHEGPGRRFGGGVAQAADRGRRLARSHRPGQFDHAPLGHAVEQVVGLGVEQDRAPHPVVPGVVVGDAPQAGLDAAEHDGRGLFAEAADQVRVGDHRPVRPPVVAAARGVVVGLAAQARGGAVGHHGVDRAAGDPPEQARLAQAGEVRGRVHSRLGDDADAEPLLDEHPADHRHAHEGRVDVGVAGDQDHVERVPAAGGHLRTGGGQEQGAHGLESSSRAAAARPASQPVEKAAWRL